MTLRTMRKAGLAILLALTIVVGNTGSAGPADVIGAPTETRDALALPFDEYKFDEQELSLLEHAYLLLVRECMRARGFELTIPSGLSPQASEVPADSRRYGVIDAETAHRFGYHFPADNAGPPQLENWEAGLDQRERAALYGDPGDPGCLDLAQADLGKDAPPADRTWLTTQDFRSLESSAKDARVVSAKREWQECMARSGRHYADPEAAISDPQWTLDQPVITAGERQTASADVLCKTAARLPTIWHTVETAAQRDVIARNPTHFNDLNQSNQRRLSNAHCVLAGSTPGC